MENFFVKLGSILAVPILWLGSLFGITPPEVEHIDQPDQLIVEDESVESPTFGAFNTVGGQAYYLAGGGISASQTSLTLTDFDVPTTDQDLAMADFGAIGYITIEPGSATRQEFISFTGITQNSNDTATLTGLSRGLSPIPPYTASTTLAKTHSGGSVVVVSNPPQLYEELATKANDETITGYWSGPTPISNSNFATKGYVDGIVSGGSVSNNQVIVAGTAGETITSGQILYFDNIQDEWMKADASVAASSTQVLIGVAQGAGTNGNTITNGVLILGVDTKNTGGSAGNVIYISDTAGATSTSPGTFTHAIGQYRQSGQLYISPRFMEVAAEANNTFSGTNSFTGTLTTATSTTIGSTYAFNIGKNQQVFTNTGNFTVPNGIRKVYFEAVGAGAGGESDLANNGGGGGGAFCSGFLDFSATSTVYIAIGSGGATDTAGGNTRISSFITAGGGAVGSGATGGLGGDCTLGSGVSGILEIENFDAGSGDVDTASTPDAATSGAGGGNVYGRGGEPVSADASAASGSMVGRAGTGYGTGGSGSISDTGNDNAGAGMPGLVIIRY